MRVCVAPQPFTRYPRLMEMIREAEDLYRDIAAASDRIRGTRSVDPADPALLLVASAAEHARRRRRGRDGRAGRAS